MALLSNFTGTLTTIFTSLQYFKSKGSFVIGLIISNSAIAPSLFASVKSSFSNMKITSFITFVLFYILIVIVIHSILNVIIECDSNEECIYDLFFDHTKDTVFMEEKQIYTNVISQNENDNYSIKVNPGTTNIAIVLNQNTGKTVLQLLSLMNEEDNYELGQEVIKNDDYMPGVIKISKNTFKSKSLEGVIYFRIEGISYASYSVYYYTYNEDEVTENLGEQQRDTLKKDYNDASKRFETMLDTIQKKSNIEIFFKGFFI